MGALACNPPTWFLRLSQSSSLVAVFRVSNRSSDLNYRISKEGRVNWNQNTKFARSSTELKGRPVKLLVQRPLCPVLARMGCQRVA